MAASSAAVTSRIRIRLAWKLKAAGWRPSSAGISVSTVTLELGTTSPIR
jgi:hypothetical protein